MHEDLIYDVGMNNGDDTAYYLHRGYRVVAVDANPELAARAGQRFRREIAEGRLTVVNVGIAEAVAMLPFWVCDTLSVWSSFDRRLAARDGQPHHAIEVPCRPFRSILEEHGVPCFLKIDIEGNEGLCLDDLDPHDLPRYVSVESYDVKPLHRLAELGYNRFKCISQAHFLPLEIPPTPDELQIERIVRLYRSRNLLVRVARRLARPWIRRQLSRPRVREGWTFPPGCSGPFGEETPGRWQKRDEMAETYQHLDRLRQAGRPSVHWQNAVEPMWTDFHARREG